MVACSTGDANTAHHTDVNVKDRAVVGGGSSRIEPRLLVRAERFDTERSKVHVRRSEPDLSEWESSGSKAV